MKPVKTRSYIFEDFLVDPDSLTVYQSGKKINLNRIRTEVLISLLEKAGDVVTKEEIIARVWPDQIHQQNNEANLSQQIFHLRRLFHDNPGSPRYILTIPGKGYIFYPQVQVISADDGQQNQDLPVERVAENAGPDSVPVLDSLSEESLPTRLTGGSSANETTWPTDGLSIAQIREPSVGATGAGSKSSTLGRLTSNLLSLMIIAGVMIFTASMIRFWFVRGFERGKIKESTISPLISRPGRKEGLVYSRDGRMLAFLDQGTTNDTIDLFVKRLNGNDILQLTNNHQQERMITWSPDNQKIAFLRWQNDNTRKYSIFSVSVFGGAESKIGEAIDGLDWDPSGRYLAISDDEGAGTPTGIYLLSVDGRERRALSNPMAGTNIFDNKPAFSPDGQEIVFTRGSSPATGELFVIDLRSGRIRQLTFDQKHAQSPQWSRNGQEILFISERNGNSRIWRISKNGGAPRLIENIVGEIAHFSLSPTTEEIAFVEKFDDSDLHVHGLSQPDAKDTPTKQSEDLPCAANSTRADHSPRFSPDGKRIVFISKRTGVDEIWLTDPKCQKVRQLTSFKTYGVGSPQWSPDGEQIVFDYFTDNQADIYKIDLIGGQTTRLTEDSASDFMPSWSHDGQWIFFTSERPAQNPTSQICQIWKIRAEGGDAQQVTLQGGTEPFQSADGKRLFYVRDEKIWTKDLPSGREAQLEALAPYRVDRYWSLSPSAIYILVPENITSSRILSLDLPLRGRPVNQAVKIIHEVSGSQVKYVSGLSISPDGKRMVISLIDKSFSSISAISNW
jgi:Tol biopolymer transport system component/DNA-binding winged helix-turn-helix (wHTH) protein